MSTGKTATTATVSMKNEKVEMINFARKSSGLKKSTIIDQALDMWFAVNPQHVKS